MITVNDGLVLECVMYMVVEACFWCGLNNCLD